MRASGEGLLTSLTDKCLLVGGDWEEGEGWEGCVCWGKRWKEKKDVGGGRRVEGEKDGGNRRDVR